MKVTGALAIIACSNIANAGIADNSTAANLTASQNYGKNGAVYFDLRQVRYMPASAA